MATSARSQGSSADQTFVQDNLTAVRAAGILSKSGTLRFDFNGLTCPSPSRPSTASVEPDEKYRLKKQVRASSIPRDEGGRCSVICAASWRPDLNWHEALFEVFAHVNSDALTRVSLQASFDCSRHNWWSRLCRTTSPGDSHRARLALV